MWRTAMKMLGSDESDKEKVKGYVSKAWEYIISGNVINPDLQGPFKLALYLMERDGKDNSG